jgi:hypothetical protein
VIGKNEIQLSEKWSEGIRTLHGFHTHGFPNLFIMSNSQSGFTTNFPHAMEEAAQHLGYIIDRCVNGNFTTVEASQAAEDAWVEEIISLSRYNEDFLAACTPGYYNNEGQPNPKSIQNGAYGKGSNPYFAKMKAWREDGTLDGLDLK